MVELSRHIVSMYYYFNPLKFKSQFLSVSTKLIKKTYIVIHMIFIFFKYFQSHQISSSGVNLLKQRINISYKYEGCKIRKNKKQKRCVMEAT